MKEKLFTGQLSKDFLIGFSCIILVVMIGLLILQGIEILGEALTQSQINE